MPVRYSFMESWQEWCNTSNSPSEYLTATAKVDLDYLHNTALLVTDADVKGLLIWHLATVGFYHWDGSQPSAYRDQVIATHEDAVAITSSDHPGKVSLMFQLASLLSSRYEEHQNISDIRGKVSTLEQALELASPEHDLRLTIVSALEKGHNTLADLETLEKRISILEGEPDSGLSSSHDENKRIGLALLRRCLDVGDIDRAILHLRSALASFESVECMYSLGKALVERYTRIRDSRDLDEAFIVASKALALATDERSTFLSSITLVLCLIERDKITHGDEDINLAIELCGKIAQQMPDNDPGKAGFMKFWANIYAIRHSRINDVQDLERAISLIGDAQPESAEQALYSGILVSLPLLQFLRSKDPQSLDEAIRAQLHLIESTPEIHHKLFLPHLMLGTMYTIRSSVSPQHFVDDGLLAMAQFSIAARLGAVPLETRFHATSGWAYFAKLLGDPSLKDAYAIVLDLLPQIAWLGLSLENRHKQLVNVTIFADPRTITLEAAATAVEQGEHGRAVEWLEQGRSVVWGQLLKLRMPVDALRKTHPDVADRFVRLSNLLEQNPPGRPIPTLGEDDSSNIGDVVAEKHRQATMEWEKLIEEIRALPGFERFLMPRTLEQLRVAAASGPIVILNASESRCDALVVLSGLDEVLYIPLYNFTQENAQRIQKTVSRLLRDSGRSVESDRIGRRFVPPDRPHRDTDTEFAECLKELWNDVVKPVLDGLALTCADSFSSGDLPRIWWCPTGPLSSLPLHAAGDYTTTEPGSKASDFVISSYIPTISSLLHDDDSAAASPPKILAIAQPSSIGQQDLPGTLDEVKVIAQKAKNHTMHQLVGLDATVEVVSAEMRGANWAHFACHGVQNLSRPAESALLLADKQRLHLSEIIKMNLPNAQFAFLSACQTATGAKDLPDEAVHLAAGMLLAGYRGVIGTMWSIADNDAPQVASDVYGMLLEGEGVPDYRQAARALHFAVKRLREGYGNRSFLRWVPYIHIGA